MRETPREALPALDPPVKPAPTEPKQLALPDGARVVDVAVSARGPQVAVALQEADGKHRILVWSVGSTEAPRAWAVPETVGAIALHPRGDALLVAARAGKQWRIARQALDAADWKHAVLVKLEQPVARLVVGPRSSIPS